jgi:hypothetical protein
MGQPIQADSLGIKSSPFSLKTVHLLRVAKFDPRGSLKDVVFRGAYPRDFMLNP